jgi:hypothetical protein
MSTAAHRARHGAPAADSLDEEALEASADERAMEIAAAQLRLVTDRRLGKTTPEWVRALAAEKPRSQAS